MRVLSLVALFGVAIGSAVGQLPVAPETFPIHPSAVCDPNNCDVDGDCHDYTFCERIESPDGPRSDTGVVTPGTCGDLYYDPDASAGSPIAICVPWISLNTTVQDQYREDATCDPYCELIPQGDCTNTYIYREPNGTESTRNCPVGTIIDVAVRRCVDSCKATPSANCPAC